MKHPGFIALVLMFGLACVACSESDRQQRAEFYVFGTILEVTTWGVEKEVAEQAFSALQSQFQRMHHEWHAWEPGALVEINRKLAAGEAVTATAEIAEMTRLSQDVEQKSGGRFNSSIGALIGLWGFHTSDYPINGPPPDRYLISELVGRNPSSLDIEISGLAMSSSNRAVQLDFGGIAKGYALDIACSMLRNMGVDNAIVNAGGDLRAFGSHGSRPWRIAVRAPKGGIIGSIETGADEAVFTSGNYERFRLDNDTRYPHILDPRTGWPVSDVASVTVITAEGWLADASATALIVAGLSDWREVARSLDLELVMLVDENGKAWLTDKMAERVKFEDGVERETFILQ